MEFKSINPYDGREIARYQTQSKSAIDQVLNKGQATFKTWRKTPIAHRAKLMAKAGQVMRDNVETYARMMTLEMGKPITEARSEINKCAWVCEYYAENAANFLADEIIKTDAHQSLVRHDPIGGVLAIMPWNFPFWQVFRFAAPTLIAGNVGLLKHAPNVFGCAKQIEEIFEQAGFPEGVFQNLLVHHDEVPSIIAHDAVKAVSLTGSEKAGAAVAEIAGKHIKKTVLELGGNNAFIVWEDADLDQAVETAVNARMLNSGQSCIAAKRFILVDGIYDEFVTKFTKAVRQLQAGDPLEETTQIGPLARKDLADKLQQQVQDSIDQGAELLFGGKQDDCYHEPTVLGQVTTRMPAFREETFGPLAAMIKAKDEEDAFALADQSRYGLGLTLCTRDLDKALRMADQVGDGAYFINELVKSDPRLPFGGTRHSGYGRELSRDGILEFINRKTVYVKGNQ